MTYTLGRDICEKMFGNMDRPSYIYYVINNKQYENNKSKSVRLSKF